MNVRLFNDNGCETQTNRGEKYSDEIRDAFEPLLAQALLEGVSLRDLQILISEEVAIRCAEERLRRGMKEHKLQQPLHKNECGCAGVCLPTDGNPQFE